MLVSASRPTFRFGSGDATDVAGHRSGQLDVVVEYPFSPTLPAVGSGERTRLYLAESVAAVVEVKSNAAIQWEEVRRTATQLAPLRRTFGAAMVFGSGPSKSIPLFVAGYLDIRGGGLPKPSESIWRRTQMLREFLSSIRGFL
jgi:hypothetical protein